jgi:hypothetical protein
MITRNGEPELVSGSSRGSVSVQNVYHIATTPLPAGPRGYNWVMLFGKHLRGGRFLARHDGIKIVAECWPDDESHLAEEVDAAIEKANEDEGAITYEA